MGMQDHAKQQRDNRCNHQSATFKANDVQQKLSSTTSEQTQLPMTSRLESLFDAQNSIRWQQSLQVLGRFAAKGMGPKRWLIASQFNPEPPLILVFP